MNVGDNIKIRWAGRVVNARVERVYKNRKLRVSIVESSAISQRSYGSMTEHKMTVEPWQVVS